MSDLRRHLPWLSLLLASAVHAGPPVRFHEQAASQATLAALRQGGYVLYMRHGTTDNTKPDRVPQVDLADCATQRPLTEAGQRLAARVGAWVRKARIPVGEIHVSPLCRAKQSALAAFGPTFEVNLDLGYTANLTSLEKQPVLRFTRTLLARKVPPGSNRVIVGHAPNLMDIMGYFPREGTIVIFRPEERDQFTYIASIPPSLWSDLLNKAPQP